MRRALARLDKEAICILLIVVIIIAVVIVLALLIWAAVVSNALKTQQEIMKGLKDLDK